MRSVLLPGFSPSRFVTAISGRGMGVSVVAEAVARLRGNLDIAPGKRGGTSLSLSVPLSVSSHRLLLVVCENETYAIPLDSIERLHRIKVTDVRMVQSKLSVNIDGRQL